MPQVWCILLSLLLKYCNSFFPFLEQQVSAVPGPSAVAEMPADDDVLTPEARTLIGVALFSLIDAAAITLKQYLKRKFGF